jgi:hypothetical protein
MRLLSSKLGMIFLVMGLTICCARAWGADWREFAEATTGIFYYDVESATSPPAYSDAKRPPIPIQTGRAFRSKPATP